MAKASKTFVSVFLFFLCNGIGFTVGPLFYVLALKFGILETDSMQAQYDLVVIPMYLWLPCALFSFSTFFLRGFWKFMFLIAPIFVPLIHILIQWTIYI